MAKQNKEKPEVPEFNEDNIVVVKEEQPVIPKVNLSSITSMLGLKFTIVARLENKISAREIDPENTCKDWEKIIGGL